MSTFTAPTRTIIAGTRHSRRSILPPPEQRLDYVFFRGATRGPRVEVLGVDRIFDAALAPHGGFDETLPSDHFALRVKLRIAG